MIVMVDGEEVAQAVIPTSIWQLMLSSGMLLTCGNLIQHAFRGIMLPYKSTRVVTYASTSEKLTTKFTRTLFFGAFSWFASFIIVLVSDELSLILVKTSLTQHLSLFVGDISNSYAFITNAVMILLVTPIMCFAGSKLRKRSGREYIERMKLG
jgi:hypothetical protein